MFSSVGYRVYMIPGKTGIFFYIPSQPNFVEANYRWLLYISQNANRCHFSFSRVLFLLKFASSQFELQCLFLVPVTCRKQTSGTFWYSITIPPPPIIPMPRVSDRREEEVSPAACHPELLGGWHICSARHF